MRFRPKTSVDNALRNVWCGTTYKRHVKLTWPLGVITSLHFSDGVPPPVGNSGTQIRPVDSPLNLTTPPVGFSVVPWQNWLALPLGVTTVTHETGTETGTSSTLVTKPSHSTRRAPLLAAATEPNNPTLDASAAETASDARHRRIPFSSSRLIDAITTLRSGPPRAASRETSTSIGTLPAPGGADMPDNASADVPIQFFQSVITIELAVAGALLWQIRYFDSRASARDVGSAGNARLRLGLALVLGMTLFGSLWAMADEGPKWAANAVTIGLAISLVPLLLRVLPPLARDAKSETRDPNYWVTRAALLGYVVIVALFLVLLDIE